VRTCERGLRILRADAHEHAALAGRRDRHVTADQKREAPEHRLLAHAILARELLAKAFGEIAVVGHAVKVHRQARRYAAPVERNVRSVEGAALEAALPGLCELLIDSVEHGASVGFLAPLSTAEALEYWQRIADAVNGGRCVLLLAGDGVLVGTVQLDVDTLPNQPHRATVSKLLVRSSARRRGTGEALMAAVERAALERGRWLLTLDTATPEAERLYARMGWTAAGPIPDYAMNPDRSLTATTWYWKRLSAEGPATGG
jgi:GNAT superfamily N-acetyltransferase